MSGLSQFTGGARVPKVLINSTSTTGAVSDTCGISSSLRLVKQSLSGALTANTLSTVLSVTGSGVLNLVACAGEDTAARTHRFKLTLDGTVVYDATTASVSSTNRGICLIGALDTSAEPILDSIPFNISCLLEYASSVSETAKTRFGLIYRTN